MTGASGGHVRILLSTYNGAPFLREQLDSFRMQTCDSWSVLWRDDGSTDATEATMAAFAAEVGPDRCRRLAAPAGNLGPRESFLALLRAAAPSLGPRDAVAFADQDDVWLPEKLARGLAALAARAARAAGAGLHAADAGGCGAGADRRVAAVALRARLPGGADAERRDRLHHPAQPRRRGAGRRQPGAGDDAA